MKKKDFKGAIFDFDYLIAPNPSNVASWILTFKIMFNIDIKPEDWFKLEGRGPAFIAGAIMEEYGIKGDVDKVKELKALIAHKLIDFLPVTPYQEIKKIVPFLNNKGIKLAIATGSTRARLEKSIPDLLPTFEATVTVDDKVQGRTIKEKPDPEQFLFSASLLGLAPAKCVVFENAELGAKAAKEGGFECWAVGTTRTEQDLRSAGANKFFPTHKNLFNHLQKILK